MGTGNTSTSGLVREEVETAVVALELLAIRNGNAAFLTDDPRAQNRLLSAARKAQLVAGHLWGLLPLASSGEVQTEAPPPAAGCPSGRGKAGRQDRTSAAWPRGAVAGLQCCCGGPGHWHV